MAFNIGKFSSKINEVGGLYRPHLYKVDIHFDKNPAGISKENLTYLANSASLPGVQILSSDHRRQNYGTFDRRAFGVQVTDIPITFFVDQNGGVLEFFNNWFNRVVNFDPGINGSEHSHHAVTKARLFEVGYRDDYDSDITITAFKSDGSVAIQYTLYEAFPIQMGDITVAWAETDSYAVVPVQFTFRTYRTNLNARQTLTPAPPHARPRLEAARDATIADMIGSGNVKPRAPNIQESTDAAFIAS